MARSLTGFSAFRSEKDFLFEKVLDWFLCWNLMVSLGKDQGDLQGHCDAEKEKERSRGICRDIIEVFSRDGEDKKLTAGFMNSSF